MPEGSIITIPHDLDADALRLLLQIMLDKLVELDSRIRELENED